MLKTKKEFYEQLEIPFKKSFNVPLNRKKGLKNYSINFRVEKGNIYSVKITKKFRDNDEEVLFYDSEYCFLSNEISTIDGFFSWENQKVVVITIEVFDSYNKESKSKCCVSGNFTVKK